MKASVKKFLAFLNDHYFYIFAVMTLLLPDLQLRYLVWPKVYGEFFATVIPFLFDIAWISLIFYGSLVLLPKNWGRLLFIVISSIFIFFSLAQYIYFQIFEQFFRLESIGLAGEGGDYLSYALSYVDGKLIFCTALSILCLIVTTIRWKRPKHTGKLAKLFVLAPVLATFLLHLFMQPELFGESQDDWDSWSKPRVIYKEFNDANKSLDIAGLYHFAARDFFKTYLTGGDYEKEDFETVDQYFAERKAEYTENQYTGLLKGKNVIAVMLEGIDDWMINDKYTPVMRYMMKNGINFANHYAPTFGTGYTLGSEFCFNTGYYTPTSSVSAVNFASNEYPYALPQLFKNAGYSANSFHYNNSEFYNRGIMHKSLGFEKYHSFMDYGLPDYVAQADSNILKNDQIYNDMVKTQPFFSFVITYSGHVPYTFDDAKLALAKTNHPDLVDTSMDTEKNNCLLLARDTDDFFRQLLERLNNDGLLENTAIIVYTDHYAYGFSDQEKLLQYSIEAGCDNMYRVPAFIYSPGITPANITKPSHTADLLPTIINLFGLENNHCYIGNDILWDKNTGFAYFGNLSWIDSVMSHTPAGQEVPSEILEQVQKGNARVRESLKINDIVITGNYFKYHK